MPMPTALSLLTIMLAVHPGPHGQDDDDVKEIKDGDKVIGYVYPTAPEGDPEATEVENATAEDEASMAAYEEKITGTDVTFGMTPIPSGTFLFGSPNDEEDRGSDEGPQVEVQVSPFWMGTHEVTWAEYHLYQFRLDIEARRAGNAESAPQDAWADAVSRPTPPYVPMDFGMGVEGYPAICMTQLAAKQYCKWLSMKTGRFYRLPTEAEWEYACRAGTTTAYSFGDDMDELEEYAWYFDNADDAYQLVGKKKPNPWGLFDMHGNVAEWVIDGHDRAFRSTLQGDAAVNPVRWPVEMYPRVVRGGSWDSDPEDLRSASRMRSKSGWKVQDPNFPKSIWYHTDARFVGFRVVRPLVEPSPQERARYWEADLEEVLEIQARQRLGNR